MSMIRAMQGLIVANPQFKMNEADIAAEFAVAFATALVDEFAKIGEFFEVRSGGKISGVGQ
jgi:hypothetical protein